MWLARENPYDVILLDIMLPGMDGLTVLRTLRDKQIDAPILMLTAKGDLNDRVAGLEAGVDDYLPKPFALAELLARVDTLVRRRYAHKNPKIRVGNLEVDTASRQVRVGGDAVSLTPRDYRLIEYLGASSRARGFKVRNRATRLQRRTQCFQQCGGISGIPPCAKNSGRIQPIHRCKHAGALVISLKQASELHATQRISWQAAEPEPGITRLVMPTLATVIVVGGFALHSAVQKLLVAQFDYALLTKASTLTRFPEPERTGINLTFAEKPLPEFHEGPSPEYFEVWLSDGSVHAKSPSLTGEQELPHQVKADELPTFWRLLAAGWPDGTSSGIAPELKARASAGGVRGGPGARSRERGTGFLTSKVGAWHGARRRMPARAGLVWSPAGDCPCAATRREPGG